MQRSFVKRLSALRQRRTDPAASHDHEVHSGARYTVHLTRRAECGGVGGGSQA